jgi:hypothetical protein
MSNSEKDIIPEVELSDKNPFQKDFPKTKKIISLQKKFYTYALLTKKGILEAFFSINNIMKLANLVYQQNNKINKLRFYSSSLPRAFETALLSAIGFQQLYKDNNIIKSVESKITKIPFFSETPEKLIRGKIVEKGDLKLIRDNRITSRTMSKGQIYAVDELISKMFKMDKLIETNGKPFHIDYSRLNPTFKLYGEDLTLNYDVPTISEVICDNVSTIPEIHLSDDDDNDNDNDNNNNNNTRPKIFRIIIMRHAESCSNAVDKTTIGALTTGVGVLGGIGTGAAVGAIAAPAAAVGVGLVAGVGSAIGTTTSMYKYKKQKGGTLSTSSNVVQTKNIFDLTFRFLCINTTNYYTMTPDNKLILKQELLNKGKKIEGKIYKNKNTLYIKTKDDKFLKASNFKQIEIYDDDDDDDISEEARESSKLALLEENPTDIFNQWEKELIREVRARENKNTLLVFVGHDKWIKESLFPNVFINGLDNDLDLKNDKFEPSNTSTFLLEFTLDTNDIILPIHHEMKKFKLEKTYKRGNKYDIEEDHTFKIKCKNDLSKYCINTNINEKLIQDYITCNYPDDNSALSIMQLALNLEIGLPNDVESEPKPIPDPKSVKLNNDTLFIYNIHFSLKNDKNTIDKTFEHYNKKYKLEKINNFSLINEKKENDECIIM